jgi:hypothetical protein
MKIFNFVDLFAPRNLNNVNKRHAKYEALMPSNSTIYKTSQSHTKFLQFEKDHPLHDDNPHTIAIQPQVVSHGMH